MMNKNIVFFKFELGEIIKDVVTGIEGAVMVRSQYATGCVHYGICPTGVSDNKDPNWIWYDETRFIKTKKKGIVFQERASQGLINELDGNLSKTLKKKRNVFAGGPFPKGPQ